MEKREIKKKLKKQNTQMQSISSGRNSNTERTGEAKAKSKTPPSSTTSLSRYP
jgi:hypothetical protein